MELVIKRGLPSLKRPSIPPLWVGVAGALWLVAYAVATFALRHDEYRTMILGDVFYVLPVAAAATFSVVAARRAPSRMRSFWAVLAASNILWVVGELTWSFYELVLHQESPFPSVADAFYLSSYALVPIAIALGFRDSVRRRAVRVLLDTSIMIAAIGFAGFHLVIEPQFAWGWSVATLTGISYPLLGIIIVMSLVVFGFSSGQRVPRSVGLVAIAFGVSALTDTGYTYLTVLNAFVSGSWLNLGWQLEAVLLCVAASMVVKGEPIQESAQRERDVTLPAVVCGVFATLAIVLWDAHDGTATLGPLSIGAFAVLALVTRLLLTAREKDRFGRELAVSLEQVSAAQAERERLLDKVVDDVEAERSHLAAELHDRPIQGLATLSYDLASARFSLESGDIAEGLEELARFQSDLGDQVEELRRLMSEIRPPALDEAGLAGALQDHLDDFKRRSGTPYRLVAALEDRISPHLETILYRVAQEAITNVWKHAQAGTVTVRIADGAGRIELMIEDDGIGFSSSSAQSPATHFGLAAMRSRVERAGGSFELSSSRGRGTTIRIMFEKEQRHAA